MLSSRRVRKGPGRRPQSAKRQRFTELREREWSILAAARKAGVSRATRTTGRAVARPTAAGRSPGSCPRWTGWPCVRSARGSCRRTSGSRSLICATRGWASGRSLTGWAGRRRRSRVSCAATPQGARDYRALRGPPPRDRAAGPQSPVAHRDQRRTEAAGRRAAGPAVEPAADQPAPEAEVFRCAGDAAVSREHLPGRLPARIAAAAPFAAGCAPAFPAAHRT